MTNFFHFSVKCETKINMNGFTSRNLFSNITLLKNKQFL